jgi:hypothetical protein
MRTARTAGPAAAGTAAAGATAASTAAADADPAGPAPGGSAAVRCAQQVKLSESAPEGTGEYPSSALLGAPVPYGRGRQSADQARDLAGWTSGELPGQVNEQLASWPPQRGPATRERLTLPRSLRPDPGLAWTWNPLESGFTAAS